MNRRGMTIAEVAVTSAVVGLMSLMIANTSRMMTRNQLRQQADLELTQSANILLKYMRLSLEKAGNGVPNYRADGRHILADLDATGDHEILFLWKDAGPPTLGAVDDDVDIADTWVRFRVEDGMMIEEQFRDTVSWRDILANPAAFRKSSRPIPLTSPSVEVTRLDFSFYDPSNTKIEDGFAASRVQVVLELAMKGSQGSPHRFVLKKDAWVLLKNVLNARTL